MSYEYEEECHHTEVVHIGARTIDTVCRLPSGKEYQGIIPGVNDVWEVTLCVDCGHMTVPGAKFMLSELKGAIVEEAAHAKNYNEHDQQQLREQLNDLKINVPIDNHHEFGQSVQFQNLPDHHYPPPNQNNNNNKYQKQMEPGPQQYSPPSRQPIGSYDNNNNYRSPQRKQQRSPNPANMAKSPRTPNRNSRAVTPGRRLNSASKSGGGNGGNRSTSRGRKANSNSKRRSVDSPSQRRSTNYVSGGWDSSPHRTPSQRRRSTSTRRTPGSSSRSTSQRRSTSNLLESPSVSYSQRRSPKRAPINEEYYAELAKPNIKHLSPKPFTSTDFINQKIKDARPYHPAGFRFSVVHPNKDGNKKLLSPY